jgi:hypothetical protein
MKIVDQWVISCQRFVEKLNTERVLQSRWESRWVVDQTDREELIVFFKAAHGHKTSGEEKYAYIDECCLIKAPDSIVTIWAGTDEGKTQTFGYYVASENGEEIGDKVGAGESHPLTDIWPDGIPRFFYTPKARTTAADSDEQEITEDK